MLHLGWTKDGALSSDREVWRSLARTIVLYLCLCIGIKWSCIYLFQLSCCVSVLVYFSWCKEAVQFGPELPAEAAPADPRLILQLMQLMLNPSPSCCWLCIRIDTKSLGTIWISKLCLFFPRNLVGWELFPSSWPRGTNSYSKSYRLAWRLIFFCVAFLSDVFNQMLIFFWVLIKCNWFVSGRGNLRWLSANDHPKQGQKWEGYRIKF